jgi:nitrate reductase / nitrite oxidoreductase, alpha subunit
MNPPAAAGVDGPASDALLKLGKFFTRWEESDDGRVAFRKGGRAGDVFYRDRWSHDKVVRSTHGVNCTGSCSWKIYVRDGIITWEAQQTDYPSVGPDRPQYETPRLPTWCRLLLVYLLAHPRQISVRAWSSAGAVSRGQAAAG